MEALLKETDPRSFLRSALKNHKSGHSPLSVAEFSRHCGFTSRSFLSEYLSGKKKLSKDSLRAIARALELPKNGKDYFLALVAQDQPELGILNPENVLSEIKRLRASPWNDTEDIKKRRPYAGKVVSKKKCFLVYAALGTATLGASLDEIKKRCHLSEVEVLRNLETLLTAGLVTEKKNRYFANEAAADFLNFDGSELSDLLKEVGTEMIRVPADFIEDANNTVVFSAFSIDAKRIPKFKKELMDAIYSVMDKYQNDAGDSVQQVFVCSRK